MSFSLTTVYSGIDDIKYYLSFLYNLKLKINVVSNDHTSSNFELH